MLDWERRTITLFADRARASEIVAEWEAHGWKVLGVDHHENAAAPTVTVTVAVPPVDSA